MLRETQNSDNTSIRKSNKVLFLLLITFYAKFVQDSHNEVRSQNDIRRYYDQLMQHSLMLLSWIPVSAKWITFDNNEQGKWQSPTKAIPRGNALQRSTAKFGKHSMKSVRCECALLNKIDLVSPVWRDTRCLVAFLTGKVTGRKTVQASECREVNPDTDLNLSVTFCCTLDFSCLIGGWLLLALNIPMPKTQHFAKLGQNKTHW